jgi:predicted nucleic acid-binding protein
MMLFDASSIITAMAQGRAERLHGGYTLPLARYEVGNVIWKQVALAKMFTTKEAAVLIETAEAVFARMTFVAHDASVTFALAAKAGLSFYDAAYASTAHAHDAVLVTEDKKLRAKLPHSHRAVSIEEV